MALGNRVQYMLGFYFWLYVKFFVAKNLGEYRSQ